MQIQERSSEILLMSVKHGEYKKSSDVILKMLKCEHGHLAAELIFGP